MNLSGFLRNKYITEEATEIAFFCNISGFRMVTQTIWKPLKFPTNLESCQKVPILKGSEYQCVQNLLCYYSKATDFEDLLEILAFFNEF